MNKLLNYALSANNLIKQIGFSKFINLTRDDLSFKIMDKLDKNHVLFLSPHPDDDIFSSGGTLAKFAKAGAKIKVVYFDNGSRGTKDGRHDQQLGDLRKKEALQATKTLGITDSQFLDSVSKKKLDTLIQEFNPEIIFVPSIVDNHPDHQAVTRSFYSSIVNLKSKITIWQYEVWTPIIPNRLVNIDDLIELKKKAIKCHKSQLECRDYLNAIIDLNSYRAKSLGAGIYAEGFFVSNLETFKTLVTDKST